MKAAVVTAFDQPPRYADFPMPTAAGPHEQLVDVLAAGLHPRVRSQADGTHYTSTGELPFVPGVDGVGRCADGTLRYFLLGDTTVGSMAEQTVIDVSRSIALPEGADPVSVAAAANPALASWMALRRRIESKPGQHVLILGATGNAGRMAVQVAKLLGADSVVAAGRDRRRLAELPATDTVSLADADQLGKVAADVDVVLDFVWGQPAADAMTALITARPDRGRPLSWVQIGAVAGATAPIPSAALRAARLQIVGSGQGSLGKREYLAELPALIEEIGNGKLQIDAKPVPLTDVENAWRSTERTVLIPGA
ncbi:zinc-binding alcohol dehydrogenase family protein [Kutzneria buriramensis]|uniref:D-arabinose 1-dehydrogenase-like Zn-dependent alcohol dehydrogenase n=1 Tax=Kutzneria buriramensis TaxID=1045776 RepID=A0A3E0H7G6_9PSEU|nr:zinc-binding alcohol dehydrogenase family protein [Kutzneria buriramensis]REH39207.1 D-arabinose 1-dehydrogenase-like Zn-dependent alcohol dehydrogenase [Kutzneria buriramensis]